MPPQKNHFATLGVEIGAGEDEIKKAFRKLAKQWHPDKNSQPGAEEKFKEINASYEFLSSKDRREIHQRDLRNPKPKQPPPKPPPPPRPPPPSQQSYSYSSTSNNNNNGTGKAKTSESKEDGKPKRPSSSQKTKGTKKPNAGSWSETFTKNFGQKKTQKEAPKETRDSFFYSSPQDDDDDVFSFTFETSKDRKHSFTSDNSDDILKNFFKPSDVFTDDFFLTVNFGAGFNQPPKTSSKPKTKPRNVAPESGNAMGLDDEYLFSPRSSRGSGSGVKEPCPWCGKLFPRGQLDQHEDKCGKFDLSGDESFNDNDSDLDDAGFFIPTGLRPEHRSTWQKQHEDHLNKVHRDKMRYRDRMASQGKRNSGFVLCPYCERSFNENAAGRHISFCKEHLKTFGRPLNTRQPEPRPNKASEQWDQDSARARANKYARGVPKPTIPNPFSKPSGVPEDGNAKRFPHPKSEVNMDDVFGVDGQSFGSGRTPRSDPHPRMQGRSSYADIHKSRQTPPRNAFTNRTNFDGGATGRKPNARTGYSHKKL